MVYPLTDSPKLLSGNSVCHKFVKQTLMNAPFPPKRRKDGCGILTTDEVNQSPQQATIAYSRSVDLAITQMGDLSIRARDGLPEEPVCGCSESHGDSFLEAQATGFEPA